MTVLLAGAPAVWRSAAPVPLALGLAGIAVVSVILGSVAARPA